MPEDYWQYFKQSNVGAVVRLNNKVYNAKRFIEGGFKHHEMYFPDGSCPSDDIVFKFLQVRALGFDCRACIPYCLCAIIAPSALHPHSE